MEVSLYRVVVDTNVLLRGLINRRSDSGRILGACEARKLVVLLSKPLIAEYRYILREPDLVSKYPQLDELNVNTAIERLMYVGDVLRVVRQRFTFFRDEKDEKLITLSLAGDATHLLTTDRDLLDLTGGRDDAAKRFRQRLRRLAVLTPDDFVRRYGRDLEIQRLDNTT